jgi:hypothetical protein
MFEFTDEDLKLNQRGQLSPGQKEWLKNVARGTRSVSWMNAWIAVGFMFLGLCLMGAMYLRNESTRALLFANPMNLLVFPLTAMVILGILALSIGLAYWNARKLESAALLSVTGKVRLDTSYSSKSNLRSYYVYVGRKRFTFGDDVSRNFKEGEKYKVYYCKPGMYEFVMSFEKAD